MKNNVLHMIRNTQNRHFSFAPTQLIIFGFLGLIVLGTVLLSLPVASESGAATNILNSLFTATSAVCVTGLVVVDTSTHWSFFGEIVILLLIQIGGLGIMSMATLFSLVLGRKVGLKERLTIQESLNEFTLSGMVRVLKNILIATVALEFLGALILSIRLIPLFGLGEGIYKSIFHAISAFCNAGFDIFGTQGNEFTGITSFKTDPLIVFTISALLITGGLGFVVWRDIVVSKKFKNLLLHTKVVLSITLVLIITGTALILVFEYNNPSTIGNLPFLSKLQNAFFHSITPRTAGFNTLPVGEFRETSKFLTIFLMFIGGAPGSTAGGVKVTTFSIILLCVLSYISGQDDTNIFGRRIAGVMQKRALSIFVIGMVIVFITTMVLLANNESSFMSVLFESVSAFGTVGLSTGITPELKTFSKLMIILTMFLGRVGPLSFAVSLSMRHSRKKNIYKYPDGKITVG